MTVLSIDFESRSTVELNKAGVYVYASHSTTDIWCMAWAFDDEEPQIWTPENAEGAWSDAGLAVRVVEHILSGGEVRAHNAQFERIIWREIMVPRYGAPELKLEQVHCTAAEAAAMSLPRSLDKVAAVTGAGEKDAEGHALMLRMCRPRSLAADGTPVWWDVPAKLQRLYEYCKQDVRTERAVYKVLRRLTADERKVYLFDQRVNDRGIRFDRELVIASKEIAAEAVERANASLIDLTGGAATSVTKLPALKAWLNEQGVEVGSLDKAAVAELLGGELPEKAREAVELRADVGRASVSKLDSMLKCACADDRLRGLLLYHGASTGRWTGKLVQPHNFPRGEVDNVEAFIPAILDRDYDSIDILAPPVVVISSLLRGMLVPAEGHDLIAADFAAIEARVLNWLAGQEDILQLFREGKDVYKYNAARLYNIPLADVQKFPHRQTGKFQELGCGFQMGAKKAVSAAKDVYGLNLTEEQAKEIVESYRASHQMVVKFWEESNAAVLDAVANPGKVVNFGALKNLRAVKMGSYLYLILPSRRPLCYAQPKIVERKTPWGAMQDAVEFSGQNAMTRRWERQSLYGGLIVENIVQATARDLLVHGMMRGEERGYPLILSVHDEAVVEVPEGFGSVAEYEKILSEVPEWATGCPVAAEGWRGKRYQKA